MLVFFIFLLMCVLQTGVLQIGKILIRTCAWNTGRFPYAKVHYRKVTANGSEKMVLENNCKCNAKKVPPPTLICVHAKIERNFPALVKKMILHYVFCRFAFRNAAEWICLFARCLLF